MLCKRPDSVSEQTNSSQGDKAGKRCNGIGGGIGKTIEMWWLKTCVQFQKGLVGGKEQKHSIPNFKSKTTLVKLFQTMIYVNKLCLVAKTSLSYELV